MIKNLAATENALWLCLLLLVPISASPLLPLGSGTLVRPLAIVPATLILLLAAVRICLLRQWPKLRVGADFRLLLLFVAYVVISGLARIATLPPETFKGQTPLGSFVRALITFAVGIAFYVTARLQLRTGDDIQRALRFLFAGMAASIALAVLQIIAIVRLGDVLRIVQFITDLFAVHYDGLNGRAQGMTFEPSWLATQIVVLVVPVLIAQCVSGQRFVGVPARKGHALRVAAGLGVAVVGLLCSGSRFGLACIALMLLFSGSAAARRGRLLPALGLGAVLLAGIGGFFAMTRFEVGAGSTYVFEPLEYLTDSSTLARGGSNSANDIADVMAMGGRLSAAQAAAGIWLDSPVFGVSFGNGYRYFGRYAPDWAFATQVFARGSMEGAGWLDRNSPEKGNAHNLFLRLLSETGIIGFILFGFFFTRQIFGTRALDGFHAQFRLSCALALAFAFINEDSLADAVVWIPMALCSAMGMVVRPPASGLPPLSE